MRFDGKTAVVTGAASGLGRTVALRLAAEGAAVACLDLAGDGAAATAKEIVAAGGASSAQECDVADEGSVRSAVEGSVEDLGALSVVVNCAGILRFHHAHEADLADWDLVLRVNLTGTFVVSKVTLPHLMESKGVIVNIASNAGLMGQAYTAAYCASKAGVVNLTKALAIEYRTRHVRVNCVAPGGMDTPMVQGDIGIPPDVDGRLFDRIMSPWGPSKPEQVANVVAFVASDEADYMTGAIVSVDAGLTA